uniref:Uncharacterized protein n=1 Tax=Rhizophora mucronata TaxID=61149 RepID=A0A2P2P999_RHIMU
MLQTYIAKAVWMVLLALDFSILSLNSIALCQLLLEVSNILLPNPKI